MEFNSPYLKAEVEDIHGIVKIMLENLSGRLTLRPDTSASFSNSECFSSAVEQIAAISQLSRRWKYWLA